MTSPCCLWACLGSCSPIYRRHKKGSIITPACSDTITDAEGVDFGVLCPKGVLADLPPRLVALTSISLLPAHSRFCSFLPLDLTAQILHDVNEIDAQRNNVAKQAWIAANVLTHDAMYFDTMAVSDMLLVARLKRAVGTAYLQKLLGLTTSPSGLHKKAELLRDTHHALRTKLRKAEPQACVAEVDAWLAGADKSPANAPHGKKNCSCEACGALPRKEPMKTPAKSHHKQQPVDDFHFSPRPAGGSTKKGKSKSRKRSSNDTSADKLDGNDCNAFEKSQSLDRMQVSIAEAMACGVGARGGRRDPRSVGCKQVWVC